MTWDKKHLKYVFFGVVGCIVLYWLLNESEQVAVVWKFIMNMISPFLVGAALAFVLNVPMRAIERKLERIRKPKLRRGTALLLTLTVVLVVVAGVFWLLVPQLERTISELVALLPGFFTNLGNSVNEFLESRPELQEMIAPYLEKMNWDQLIQTAVNFLSTSLSTLFSSAISLVGGVTSAIFNAVISFVFALYCLSSKETLARQGRKMLYSLAKEKTADEIVRVLRMTNSAFSNFITGQCLEAVILALLFVIAMMLFRMPYIPLICVLIGVTALVPLVGAFIGCILGAFFILVSDPMQAVTFVIMFLAIQQFEGNVIYPRVVGSSIGLPGMWVLLAVAVGGELMGVAGMLVMVPFASVLYTLFGEFTTRRLAEKKIDESKLTPQPPELQLHFKGKAEAPKKQVEPKAVAKNNTKYNGKYSSKYKKQQRRERPSFETEE